MNRDCNMPAAARHVTLTAEQVRGAWRRAPAARVQDVTEGGPTLVLAPHPDDETLGCGGLIAAAGAQGEQVHILVVTDGAASHPNSPNWPAAKRVALRQDESRRAAAILGLGPERIAFLGLPDGAAPRDGPSAGEAAGRIAAHAAARHIRTVVTTWPLDPHTDHIAVGSLGHRVSRLIAARLLFYPIWAWQLPATHPLPAWPRRAMRLDIAAQRDAKRRAIACHASQLTDLMSGTPGQVVLSPAMAALFAGGHEVFLSA